MAAPKKKVTPAPKVEEKADTTKKYRHDFKTWEEYNKYKGVKG